MEQLNFVGIAYNTIIVLLQAFLIYRMNRRESDHDLLIKVETRLENQENICKENRNK